MKLSEKDALQLAARKVSFGRGISDSTNRLVATLHQILNSGDELQLYDAMVCVNEVKNSIEAVHNLNHELCCLAAKTYLERRYPKVDWERVSVLEKDVNAVGPDLLIEENKRIVAEVKTTEPKSTRDFGSEQKKNIKKDLDNLSSEKYSGFDRYFFVSSSKASHILDNKYKSQYPSVNFVLLKPEA
jgi:hypothetical protein